MFTKKNVIVAIVCVLALTAWSGTAFAALIDNGGFENDFAGFRTLDWLNTGGVTINTTDVYQGAKSASMVQSNFTPATPPYAPETYSIVDIDNSPNEQAILTPGQNFTFSFAAKKTEGSANARLKVWLGVYDSGNVNQFVCLNWEPLDVPTGVAGPSGYTVYSYNYTLPTGTPAYQYPYIGFTMSNSDWSPSTPASAGYLIDAVSLTGTPEPSTLVLLVTGLLGLLCYAWRKRR